MTLVQLRYLVALDNSRHFRQAAAQLGISQPSLSNQLGNLESELGAQLFDRSTKPISPTPVGEQVIAQARVVLGEAERLEVIVKGIAGEMAGELRIGILPTLAPYIVPQAIAKFSNRYPDVKVEVHELLGKQVAEYIKRDLIDVGLVTSPLASRGIVEDVLFEEPLLCYIAEGHPLFRRKKVWQKDLSVEGIWLLKEGHALREQIIALCPVEQGKDPVNYRLSFESDSIEALKRLVESGQGMTVIPWLSTVGKTMCDPSLIRPFSPATQKRTVRMIHAKRLIQTQLAQALAEEIKATYAMLSSVEKRDAVL
ncbi:MAG: LysR family transcriptional regulator [Rhodothermaceae bacterium]|nr:LysR family transcriptional regulator [Rhodothermaceae bacterium]